MASKFCGPPVAPPLLMADWVPLEELLVMLEAIDSFGLCGRVLCGRETDKGEILKKRR